MLSPCLTEQRLCTSVLYTSVCGNEGTRVLSLLQGAHMQRLWRLLDEHNRESAEIVCN
jgi:hypothetical protein